MHPFEREGMAEVSSDAGNFI